MKSFKDYIAESKYSSSKITKAINKIADDEDIVMDWDRQANKVGLAIELLNDEGIKISKNDKDFDKIIDEFFEIMDDEAAKYM